MVKLLDTPTPKKVVKHQIINTADVSENIMIREDDSLLNLSNANNGLISAFQQKNNREVTPI